jgi:osmoprotectant transport system ATP-binding protein
MSTMPAPAVISFEHVGKVYDGVRTLDGVTLAVAEREFLAIVGGSGAGKTTLLRLINRLIDPSEGVVRIEGEDVRTLDPIALRRRIGYVFQNIGLFPHMTVAENIAITPRLLGWDASQRAARVDELIDLVRLDRAKYRDRLPHQLSGGERQRVGVARALGGDPAILLMDEPFSAVDPITRKRLQQELLELQAKLKKTIVFVTHDIDEATLLGDRIAVLSKGAHVEQYDTPNQVLGRPATAFVADFVGADRGVRRLAVMPIDADSLFHPPEVSPELSMLDARAAAAGADSRWAVVVDDRSRLKGWIDLEPSLSGSVEDNIVPFEVQVPLGTSLRAAFGEMLQHDVHWVPVVEDDRYLGVLTPNSLHAAVRRSVGGKPIESRDL